MGPQKEVQPKQDWTEAQAPPFTITKESEAKQALLVWLYRKAVSSQFFGIICCSFCAASV